MCMNYKAVLSDIEGTTTAIDFVKNILFPYAVEHVEEFIRKIITRNETECIYETLISDLIQTTNTQVLEYSNNNTAKIGPDDEGETLIVKLIQNIRLWIQQDKKYTSLKNLQGLIWEEGYRCGQLKSHVYSDIPKVFQQLNELLIPIYIYSSGSVKAQQLLFSHTNYGDLTTLLSGYFDTNMGPKFETESYLRIAANIGILPSEGLFLTDVGKEALAAGEAGFNVRIVVREGNAPIDQEISQKFKIISSFKHLNLS